MDTSKLEIGHPLKLVVRWYDKVPEPPKEIVYDGEVIGWRGAQVIVRVPGYSVVRFWKKNGLEVGNPDHARRGFMIAIADLKPEASTNNTKEIDFDDLRVAVDTDA